MDTSKKLIESKVTDKEVTDLLQNPLWMTHPFVKKWYEGYEKKLKEAEPEIGALRGQTTGDATSQIGAGSQVYATLEIFNAVIRGFTRYMDDSFVRKYVTDSVIFKVPKVEYRELVSTISSGQLPHTEKTIDYATVDLSTPESEKGGKVTWTRALLEDITFDVQAEMAEGLGHAIAFKMMSDITAALIAVPPYKEPLGANNTISSPITWAQFLAIIGAVDTGFHIYSLVVYNGTLTSTFNPSLIIGMAVYDNGAAANIGICADFIPTTAGTNTTGTLYFMHAGNSAQANVTAGNDIVLKYANGTAYDTFLDSGAEVTDVGGFRTYGPADFCIVSPDVYWELLNIIQMTNVLYEGSTDPIKRGLIKLALGCTISKQGALPRGTIVALNSEKAVALVTRRTLKIEPVLFPVWNEYGFIGTVRYGVTRIFDQAIQIGTR